MHIDDDILNLVAQGDYLDAARLLQSRRGITLDEAAAKIDRLRGDITPLDPASAADPITPAIAEAIRSGRTIGAIKLYRQAHGVALKAVDAYEAAARGSTRTHKNANPVRPSLLLRLFGWWMHIPSKTLQFDCMPDSGTLENIMQVDSLTYRLPTG